VCEFFKKSEAVEAFQMTRERRYDNSEWPTWLHKAWQKEPHEPGCLFCIDEKGNPGSGERLRITTLGWGVNEVAFNDYIVRSANGELHSCKPDVFEQMYEPINRSSPDDKITVLEEAERALESMDIFELECALRRYIVASKDIIGDLQAYALALEIKSHIGFPHPVDAIAEAINRVRSYLGLDS